jgi:integrase
MTLRLHTREARKKLTPREEAYWFDLRRGLAIGYKRRGQNGTWWLREFKRDPLSKAGGRYVRRRLGLADDVLPANGTSVLTWQDATTAALSDQRPTVTKPGKLTLSDAARAYFDTRQARNTQDEFTWKKFIGSTKLAGRTVSEITTGELELWLASQVPPIEDREIRRRAQATANRRWSVLRAILNSAFRKDPARVPSDAAWRRVKAFAKADRPRTRTLTAEECKRLLTNLREPLGTLAHGSLYTGLRFGELVALQAGDVGPDFVRVRNSKSGKPRTVPLNGEGAAFFAGLTRGNAAEEPVFGKVIPMEVSRQMRAACQAAGISPPAVFHDLRRTYGSLLINNDVSADLIQDLLGHADVRMTRRTYAHLASATLLKAVRKLPSFLATAPEEAARR